MLKIIGILKDIVWGVPTLLLLLVFGMYFTRRSGFYRAEALKGIFRDTVGSLKKENKEGISPFSAVATALGGTVGIGSIVGVGYGIAVGGAGSIFWMWVCSFFGMGLKYAEVKIALNGRRKTDSGHLGGAPFRLRSLGYKKTAVIFCLLCIAVSFSTGNITQTGVMSSFLISAGASKKAAAILCCAVIGFALFGGRKGIAKINSFLVPFASAVYLTVCLCIIILNISGIGDAFYSIFSQAFGFSAVTGGFSGAVLSHVIREGFARSLFSNEAGMGSSPLAHATSNGDTEVQAKWGIFEIFFDSFIFSTLTAICLLSGNFSGVENMFLLTFGKTGFWMFGIFGAVFAFASVISWCYYAECCIDYLFPKSKAANVIYRLLFTAASALGIFVTGSFMWELADVLNALMMFPNLFLLFKCRNEIERMK